MLADAAQRDALHAALRALEQEVELVGGELGVGEAGLATDGGDARVLGDAVLVDEAARRMVGLGELGERVLDRRAALLHLGERARGAAAPRDELRGRVAGVLGDDLRPRRLLLGEDAAHPLGDELVLRLEVAVERHLRRARRFGDRLHADAADADAPEELVGGGEDALASRLAHGIVRRVCHRGRALRQRRRAGA